MPEKKSVKKKSVSAESKKSVKADACCTTNNCHCNVGCIKLSSMAFILFLVTIWPKIGAALLSVHWGWYLGIFVVLGAGAISTHKHCWCCKK